MNKIIIAAANYVYSTLGAGHEEAIYRDAMSIELQDRGFTVKTEAPISIKYRSKKGKDMIVGSGKIDLYVIKAGKYYLLKQNLSTALPEKEIIEIAIQSLGLTDINTFSTARGLGPGW